MKTISPAQLERDCLRQLYTYWRAKQDARDGALPRRADIDPLELPPAVLPHILLVERIDAPTGPRWRYRLIGQSVATAAGLDLTWSFVDEVVPNDYGAYVAELYRTLCRLRRPLYSESLYRAPGRTGAAARMTRRLMLPLATDEPPPGAAPPAGDAPGDAAGEAAGNGTAESVGFVLSGQVFGLPTGRPEEAGGADKVALVADPA